MESPALSILLSESTALSVRAREAALPSRRGETRKRAVATSEAMFMLWPSMMTWLACDALGSSAVLVASALRARRRPARWSHALTVASTSVLGVLVVAGFSIVDADGCAGVSTGVMVMPTAGAGAAAGEEAVEVGIVSKRKHE